MTMASQKQAFISTINIFQDLALREVDQLDHQLTMTTCEAGRVFYRPGETIEVLFILKKGQVQLYRLSPEGKKLVVADLKAGTIFGEMSLIGQGMQNTFAEAVDDCTLCVMSRTDVERILREKPQVALRLLEAMADRLRMMESKLEELAFKGIPARLAGLLLELAQSDTGESDILGFTHQDFAERIGTYRETITQVLSDFQANGWVKIGRKHIQLLDPEALASLT
jgi:CRP/FNR family cyclic AMP-dependent transcriptional regulator